MTSAVELHGASFSYEDVPGGQDIVFHDPFEGEVLDPSRIPRSIVAQPHLLAGINHLIRISNEKKHAITLAGANHANDSQFDLAELHDMVGEHDVVFLEGMGHNAHHRYVVRQVGEGRSDLPEGFATAYHALQLAAINGHKKPVAYADLPSDGTSYERALIEWCDLTSTLLERAQSERDSLYQNLYRAVLINLAGSSIFREWQMLGSIGNSLNSAERSGNPIENSLFLVGTEHTRTLPSKLGLLGVRNTPVELTMRKTSRDTEEIDSFAFDFTTAVRDYRARIK